MRPRAGGSESGVRSLANEVPFELRQGAGQVEHELAARTAGVELLVEAVKADASPLKGRDHLR